MFYKMKSISISTIIENPHYTNRRIRGCDNTVLQYLCFKICLKYHHKQFWMDWEWKYISYGTRSRLNRLNERKLNEPYSRNCFWHWQRGGKSLMVWRAIGFNCQTSHDLLCGGKIYQIIKKQWRSTCYCLTTPYKKGECLSGDFCKKLLQCICKSHSMK